MYCLLIMSILLIINDIFNKKRYIYTNCLNHTNHILHIKIAVVGLIMSSNIILFKTVYTDCFV